MPPDYVIERLQPFQPEIKNLPPQIFPVDRYFECYDRLISKYAVWKEFMTWLGERRSIGREDLRELSHECSAEKRSWTELFIATMLWGYSDNDDSGPVKLFRSLGTGACDATIKTAALQVHRMHFADAFVTIRSLKEIGASYATKFLYSSGLSGNALTHEPLVLDRKIADALSELYGEEDADERFDLRRRNYTNPTGVKRAGEAYTRYCEEMHQLAQRLNCQAAKLEQFLFGNLKKLKA